MLKFENQTNGRYYYIYVETDLFGDNVLRVIRGGCGIKRVSGRVVAGNSEIIEKELKRLSRIRLQRGYTLVN